MNQKDVEDVQTPPEMIFQTARDDWAPVFSILNTMTAGSRERPVKQLTDLRFATEVAGGRLMQNLLLEPDYNITVVFMSTDRTLNEMKMNELRTRLVNQPTRIYKDLFHENFIWDMIRNQGLPDLNLYRIGVSLFKDYDANEVLFGKLKWSNLKLNQKVRLSNIVRPNLEPSDDDAKSVSSSKSDCSSYYSVNARANPLEGLNTSAESNSVTGEILPQPDLPSPSTSPKGVVDKDGAHRINLRTTADSQQLSSRTSPNILQSKDISSISGTGIQTKTGSSGNDARESRRFTFKRTTAPVPVPVEKTKLTADFFRSPCSSSKPMPSVPTESSSRNHVPGPSTSTKKARAENGEDPKASTDETSKEALTTRWVHESASMSANVADPASPDSDIPIYSESEEDLHHRSVSMSPIRSRKPRAERENFKSPTRNRTQQGLDRGLCEPQRKRSSPAAEKESTAAGRADYQRPGPSRGVQTAREVQLPGRTVTVTKNPCEKVADPVSFSDDDSEDTHEVSSRRSSVNKKSRGPPFTKQEQQKMIDWVCRRRDHDRIMSQDLYTEMEKAKICPGRTHHSLSNNFRKTIVKHLDRFKMDERDKKLFLRRINQRY